MNKKKLKYLFSLVPAMGLTGLVSCASNAYNPKYNLVSPDYQMSESLAVLGYVPSLVTSNYTKNSYNDFPEQKFENISYGTNVERLLTDKPQILMYYNTGGYKIPLQEQVESYGGKYLEYPKLQIDKALNYNLDASDENKQNLSYSWANVKEFWKNLNNLFVTPIEPDYEAKIDAIQADFNQKVGYLRDLIDTKYGFIKDQKINITTWGANAGINYSVAPDNYEEFGYDISQIDWLLGSENSLNFQKALPGQDTYIFKKGITPQGYGVLGWWDKNANTYPLDSQVQSTFYASTYTTSVVTNSTNKPSDLVFVKYDINGDNDPNVQLIKTHFAQMIAELPKKNGLDAKKEDRVIIVPSKFGFFEYSPLSWMWCLNELYSAFGFDKVEANEKQLFDLSKFKQNLKSFEQLKLQNLLKK